jgi:peptidyl-prolyl cis-trans isomerase D
MISFFRKYMFSKAGAVLATLFLALIAFGFVAGDLSSSMASGNFSNFFSGSNVATMDGKKIAGTELQSKAQKSFESVRRDNPGLPFDTFLSSGGVERALEQIIGGEAVLEFARKHGIFVSKRMIDAEIAAIPAFHDASGKFSQNAFHQLLSSQGISEESLRRDISKDITSRLLVTAAGLGSQLPDSLVLPYASLLLEVRQGSIAAIPSAALAPKEAPSDAQLAAFYKNNAARFTIPEQRKLRYATVDISRFAAAATPSDAEVAAYYTQNKARYAASETRSIEQLILSSESAAKAALGKPLAQAAKEAGLEVGSLTNRTQSALAAETSDALAKAAFAANQGATIGPVKSALGWALVRISAVQKIPATSLEQARGKIVEALTTQKQAQLLNDFTAKLEDESANGATFDEVVKDNGLKVEETPSIISTGQNVEDPNYKPAAELAPIIKAGFDMEADDEPQLVPVTAQKSYALVDVGQVTAAAPPPIAKVRELVTQQYLLNAGSAKASALAESLRAKIAKGMSMDQALAGAGIPLPPVQRIGGRRADMMRQDKQVPPEVALLFTIPKGTVKVMPISGDRGYFIIRLDGVQSGDAAKVPGLVDRVRGGLNTVAANEYVDQLGLAIQREVGVKRNDAVLKKVKAELRRINGSSPQ